MKKATKADAILELVGREDGASIPEICQATGLQRHTRRGYIAGPFRKRGQDNVGTGVGGMTVAKHDLGHRRRSAEAAALTRL
ncbi:DUF3489 domain-containing protein [Kaistia defluvii]|uniref:DUF3489 domain-containing protein n=1 Tax=Kaistia defluvii TaxID=410841 RepID=UPI0038990870